MYDADSKFLLALEEAALNAVDTVKRGKKGEAAVDYFTLSDEYEYDVRA